ncbi:DUF1707 SHOCT-like domain-containing protein [Mycolicibacterium arenosum]|uniref:DUF1707 domain-containing protein n=1 Tax=Mycolicibacterium arenosum TaxID=2952157 RepID=A0ABT1M701_9MYCO|nr:DUF1707 domain-containing protein [Mycolicibacterium sp. CAU 1645]MCP9274951.1 DUF1707 domain-containing protein [Mycolicibacterium sp. CAU 1645]
MASRKSSGTRAKDTDRNDTCQILDSALADGQLSMEEHRTRVTSATSASTLGELQALVSDLQNDNAPVQLPDLKPPPTFASAGGAGRARGIGLAFSAVLVLLGIAIGWGLYGNSSSPFDFTTDPGAKSDNIEAKVLTPPRQLHSLGGLNGLFEQMRQRFGDTLGYSLTVYPDYASLDRADPAEPRRVLDYTYRGGWGDSTSDSAKGDDDVLVDLAAIDVPAVVAVLRGAPQTLGIEPADVTGTYLTVDPARTPVTPGELTLSIHVSSELGGSGHMQIDGKGRLKNISYPS